MPTATSVAAPVTVAFNPSSSLLYGNGTWTGCPSGCSFNTNAVSRGFSGNVGWGSSYFQTQLGGTVTLANQNNDGFAGNVTIWTPGNGACVNPSTGSTSYYVSLNRAGASGGYSTNVTCQVSASSPSSTSINYNAQYVGDNGYTITINFSGTLYGYGYYQEQQWNCNNAIAYVVSQEQSPASSYFSSATAGQIVASGPSYSTSGYCSPSPWTYTQYFTAYETTTVTGTAYAAGGPQSAALTSLNAQIQPNYTWNSKTQCNPSTIGVNGGSVTVSCQDSGVEVWSWTAGSESTLASALAAQGTVTAATAYCNSYPGVQAGTCSITGNTSNQMPPASGISISVLGPTA